MKTTAWQLFNRNFKLGDAVIVIDDYDKMAWGSLHTISDAGFRLVKSYGRFSRHKFFSWDEIRFMCHDGFPVKQLFGADGSETIESEPNMAAVLRTGLRQTYRQIVFGDPFLIESVAAETHNTGNDGPEHWWEDSEESLELVAPDGARAQLWDLNTVFHVGTA